MKLNTALITNTLITTTLISGTILASTLVSADNDSVVDEINITVPESCSISGTGMDSHNANIANGIYTADIGTTTLHAFCNDNEGFAIYAAGYTGNEVGGTNSNKLVGTSASGNATIESGIATTAGNPDISNWAMKLTITQDSGNITTDNAFTIDSAPNEALPSQAESGATEAPFSSYHVVPNEYTKVAHKNSGTDMAVATGGVKLATTYAAYISKTQPADTYSGQVVYTLVYPSSHRAPVVYNTNADDIAEITYLQEFAVVGNTNRAAIIDSMVPETQYIVTDARDGKTYTIAKYQTKYDDRATGSEKTAYGVWMTKNLDLDIEQGYTYTNEDTDIGYNTTTGEYDTASWTPGRSTYQPTSTYIHEWCAGGTWNSQYGYCENNDTPESYDPGNLYWNLTESDYDDWDEYYNSCDFSTSTSTCDQSKNPISTYVSSTGIEQYHLGNYYNWAAATATNDSSTFNRSYLVEQSICPAGWTLPRVDTGEDTFYSLWNQYGFHDNNGSYNDANNNGTHDANESALWTSPLYFVVGGYFDGGLGDIGYDGGFWAPVPDGVGDASYAGFDVGGGASSSGGYGRFYGKSVRCILRPEVNSESGSGGGEEI